MPELELRSCSGLDNSQRTLCGAALSGELISAPVCHHHARLARAAIWLFSSPMLIQRHHAGLEPGQLAFVAVHGTGTPLGDPIEVGALGTALVGAGGQPQHATIGSVKSCYGHTEGCAGLTGALMAMQALRYQVAPSHHLIERLVTQFQHCAGCVSQGDSVSCFPMTPYSELVAPS